MYIKFNKHGEYGFYTPEIHGEEFCNNECIEIADELYNYLLENNGKYLINVDSVSGIVTKDNLIERPIRAEKIEPSLEQRNRADIDYIGMMTGVF